MEMRFYNVQQAYKEKFEPLGMSNTSLYRAIALGKLKAVKCGKRYIISEKAINDYFMGAGEDEE